MLSWIWSKAPPVFPLAETWGPQLDCHVTDCTVENEQILFITWHVLTWEQGEGDRVDAILLGGGCALRVGDIHLEFDWLLEDCRARCGLVLCSETGLRDHTVAQAGDLAGKQKSRGVSEEKWTERQICE